LNQSKDFIQSVCQIGKEDFPEIVLNRAKQSLLDYLAVTCAGKEYQKEKLKNYFTFSMPEKGDFKAIGTGKRLALKETVFLNGLNAHALDFDDGTNSGIIHLGSPIFSVLIPLAERYDCTIKKMLEAAIIGYEASYTIAVSIQPAHKALGYHATGTCGTLGAALAAACMLDFAEEERFQAFAAACVAASGVLKVLDDGSELKPYNVAKTSLLALTAIQMAKAGFKGHDDPLGGRGFLKMMTGSDNIELKPVLLNGTYAIMKSYTKPYASCRYTHPAVEAAIHLRDLMNIDEINEIEVKTYELAVPGHDHTVIPGSYSAKMSIPYATAAGLIYGKAGLQEFSENTVKDGRVLALTKKVKVTADRELSKLFPGIQAAEVTIRTDNGEYCERVDYPKGEPENPLTDEEFRNRYKGLMAYAGINDSISSIIFETVHKETAKVEELVKNL